MNTELMFSSEKEDRETPQNFFDELNKEFHFTLDAAASPENTKCDSYFTKEQNGLTQSWAGQTVWVNPPYGRYTTGLWVKKGLRRTSMHRMHDRYAAARANRYDMVSRVHTRKSRNPIRKRATEIR